MQALSRSVTRALVFTAALALLVTSRGDAGVYGSSAFHLGDGQAPSGFAGAAGIQRDGGAAPDWADLFDADGNVGDFAQYGGLGAAFIADNVSLGAGFEGSALAGAPDRVRNGTARSADDIGNAYVYLARDGAGQALLFLGVERLGGGDSFVEFELNQTLVRLGHGGFGVNKPWPVLGARSDGDLLVRIVFVDGAIASASVDGWLAGSWLGLAVIGGEGCDEGENFCALGNAGAISTGSWSSYATDADSRILAGRFAELGINLGAFLGGDGNFRSIRVRTPGDIAFGYLGEGN